MDNCCTTITIPTGPEGPTGPQAPLFVSNTVFLDETFGSDATGAPQRRDLPYKTKAAAIASALTLTPAVNKRILIDVASVYSNVAITLTNFVDWDLRDGVIEVTSGALAAIDDNNVAVNSIIYGDFQIKRSTAGTNAYAVRTQNAATSLTVYGKEVTSSLDAGLQISGGTIDIFCRIVTTATNDNAVEKSGGVLRLNSNVLISNGTGLSLFAAAPTQNVLIYGAVMTNKTKSANISLTGGLYVVDAAIS